MVALLLLTRDADRGPGAGNDPVREAQVTNTWPADRQGLDRASADVRPVELAQEVGDVATGDLRGGMVAEDAHHPAGRLTATASMGDVGFRQGGAVVAQRRLARLLDLYEPQQPVGGDLAEARARSLIGIVLTQLAKPCKLGQPRNQRRALELLFGHEIREVMILGRRGPADPTPESLRGSSCGRHASWSAGSTRRALTRPTSRMSRKLQSVAAMQIPTYCQE